MKLRQLVLTAVAVLGFPIVAAAQVAVATCDHTAITGIYAGIPSGPNAWFCGSMPERTDPNRISQVATTEQVTSINNQLTAINNRIDDLSKSVTATIDAKALAIDKAAKEQITTSVDGIPQRLLVEPTMVALKTAILSEMKAEIDQLRRDLEAQIASSKPAPVATKRSH